MEREAKIFHKWKNTGIEGRVLKGEMRRRESMWCRNSRGQRTVSSNPNPNPCIAPHHLGPRHSTPPREEEKKRGEKKELDDKERGHEGQHGRQSFVDGVKLNKRKQRLQVQ